VIGFWITSNLGHPYSMEIKIEDFAFGETIESSAVRIDGVVKISKNLLVKKIAATKGGFRERVVGEFLEKVLGKTDR